MNITGGRSHGGNTFATIDGVEYMRTLDIAKLCVPKSKEIRDDMRAMFREANPGLCRRVMKGDGTRPGYYIPKNDRHRLEAFLRNKENQAEAERRMVAFKVSASARKKHGFKFIVSLFGHEVEFSNRDPGHIESSINILVAQVQALENENRSLRGLPSLADDPKHRIRVKAGSAPSKLVRKVERLRKEPKTRSRAKRRERETPEQRQYRLRYQRDYYHTYAKHGFKKRDFDPERKIKLGRENHPVEPASV